MIYLKLGLGTQYIDNLDSVPSRHFQECMRTPQHCHFPQDLTYDDEDPMRSQKYTPDQFVAYKELGRAMTHRVRWVTD